MRLINLKQMTVDEIKFIEFEILKYVADFCERHNIRYILDSGTLIGAVRHNGFIPWDDDIDISMLRADYENFIELWGSEEHGKFDLLCIEKGNYIAGFAKVINSETICYEANIKRNPIGCFIDIFPLDFVPENKSEIERHHNNMIKLEKYWRASYWGRIKWQALYPIYTVYKSIVEKDLHYLFLYNAKKIILIFKKKVSKYSKGNFVTNYAIIYPNPPQQKFGFPASCCTDYIYHEFEGECFRIPKDYDSVLRSFYGDYMHLPPIEERVSHHKIIAYWKHCVYEKSLRK